MFRKTILLAVSLCTTAFFAKAQQGVNTITIAANDSRAAIIKKAAHVRPSVRQLRWQQLEVTGFLHFGINTFTNKEWGDGKEDPALFNPVGFNAEQWVKVCKDAGIKQVIITAKHHDGFCLWPSKYTEHSLKNSPWKNGKGDVVKDVAEACRKYKMGFGIYLSPWDRNSPYYGDNESYNQYFINQLTELLTNYGKVDEVWFDGANGEGPNGKKQVYDLPRWYALIRKLQPEAIIANMGPDVRWVGTETGKGRLTEWSVLPLDEQEEKKIAAASQTDVMIKPNYVKSDDLGSREKLYKAGGMIWYPAETDVSIRPGWFYHPDQDAKVKTPEQLMDIYFTSVGRNGVLLLNIPPDNKGVINTADINSLRGWQGLMDKTFSHNLAKGAQIACSNGAHTEALTEEHPQVSFTTKNSDTSAVITLTLGQKSTFDVLQLQEDIKDGQRVEQFAAEYWDGNSWKQFIEGTTIGYKRLLKFEPVTADKVRLIIRSSRANPLLNGFGLYQLAH